MRPKAVLETVLYATDIAAMRRFYEGVLGLDCLRAEADRHAFFRIGPQMLLVFNPALTETQAPDGPDRPPAHGAPGPGHACFSASAAEIARWRKHLEAHGVVIETEFDWTRGGRSLYVRDPAGNSIEFAEPRIWGLSDARLRLSGARLVVASHNPGKVKEIADLLASHDVEIVSAAALGLAEPEETGETFAANALLKAQAAAGASGLPALADDSGLSVDALGGQPGIHSARWTGPTRDFALAMRNVEEKLQAKGAVPPARRTAHFVSVLSAAWPDGDAQIFSGRIDGALVWPPRGSLGFGYDPMFLADGCDKTFGEMEPQAKHAISHRARAFAKLADALL